MDQDESQKPKPSAEAKQMGGPAFYSALSKDKRTLHCDDDSSGSQPHQPPLKRQTRLGAKQAERYVGINNNDSDPTDSNPVDECTSAEVALRNDLVLESMFRYINQSDLLSCRVVNKKWKYEATKELRRRKLVIRFSTQSLGNSVIQDTVFQDVCRRLRECSTPSLLSSFQVKTGAFNNLGSAGVRSIFSTVGNQLKHLTLNLNYFQDRTSFKGSSLMTDLQNLLFCQAPSLEFLEIEFDFHNDWKEELQVLDSSDLLQDDSNEFRLLPNLKTFIVDGTPPPKLFADVIKAAVNLRSLGGVWSCTWSTVWRTTAGGGPSFGEFWSACIKYFLGAEGRDKIHLMKSFKVYLEDERLVKNFDLDIELMKMFLTEHKQNLQVETFECVATFWDDGEPIAMGSNCIGPRIVNAINQILESSSGSLQKLRIEPAKWFDCLFVIPRLPKLKEICFDCVRSSLNWPSDGEGFFPPGFNINNSFPNVSSIVLLRCDVPLFRVFVSRMMIEMTEPVLNVRHITIINPGKAIDILPLSPEFQRIFRNLLSFSHVDSDKFYSLS